ncbi:MAG: hypothetical protein Q8905_11965, partial [Bacteroidota bacterium]|nr:hypothetical protein [Bacteroidota bacterium]
YTINREIQRWEIGRQEEMAFNLENLIFTLEANTPLNFQSNFILDRIKQIPEQKDVAKQYGMLSSIFTLIIKSSLEQNLQEIGEKVNQIGEKLEEITISLKELSHNNLGDAYISRFEFVVPFSVKLITNDS